MSLIRTDNFIEAYRARAAMEDIHALSGRDGSHEITLAVADEILNLMQLVPADTLVDVGCGDGTLLSLAAEKHQTYGTGILPTAEETIRLKAHLEKLDLHEISVILLLSNTDAVVGAVKELARITRSKGLIFIGEVPFCDESHCALDPGLPQTMVRRILYVVSKYGFFKSIKLLALRIRLTFQSRVVVIAPPVTYWASQEGFANVLAESGLQLLNVFPTSHCNTRLNYLARKL